MYIVSRCEKDIIVSNSSDELNPKQQRFVQEYLIDLNATQAALRSGYSKRSAMITGHRLLKNAKIAARIDRHRADKAAALSITAERVLREYARIAFADVRQLASVEDLTWVDEKLRANGITVRASDTWSDDLAAAVAEISATAHGPKIKMHDKQHALDALSKHLGLFQADNEQSTPQVACPQAVDIEDRLRALEKAVER